jgi:ribosomal protein L12E/L44/L45/RPP1/RPP2
MRTNSSTKTARTSHNHSPRTGLVETVVTEQGVTADVLEGSDLAEVAEAIAEATGTTATAPAKKATKATKATTKPAKAEKEPAKKAKTSRQLTEEKLAEGGHAGYLIAHHYFGTSWTVKDAEGKGFLFNRETGEMVEDTPEARKAIKPVK